MSFANQQRASLIKERGQPALTLEFDVFGDGQISMWTHFDHGADFQQTKNMLTAIRDHLSEFLRDEGMCPFHGKQHP